MTPEPSDGPSFTEDDVACDFVDAIDAEVVGKLGWSGLRGYEWAADEEDEDSGWPFTVLRDGREFEIDIDVRVVELTPEVKARRESDAQKLLALLQRHGAQAREPQP